MRYYFLILFALFGNTVAYALEQDSQSCNSLSAPSSPLFAPAQKEKDDMLHFNPFFKIDWMAIAPEWITGIDSINPSKEDMKLLRENMYYESSSALTYKAPLDCTTQIGRYQFISDSGISSVKLSNLEGRTRFIISGYKIIDQPEYGGDIVFFPPSHDDIEGGFVMLTEGQHDDGESIFISPDPEFSASQNRGKVIYTYVKSGEKLQFTKNWYAEYDHPLEILTMYMFQMDTRDYIYVRWAANQTTARLMPAYLEHTNLLVISFLRKFLQPETVVAGSNGGGTNSF